MRPKQPSEDWVRSLWEYICTNSGDDNSNSSDSKSGRGGVGGGVGINGRGRRADRDPAEVVRLFERSWPLLPATGGVGSDQIRVLLELHEGMPVVSPLADGVDARTMTTSVIEVCAD